MAKKKSTDEAAAAAVALPVQALQPSHIHKDQEQEIQYIKISDILPSPTNPRRHVEDGPLVELGDSIRKFGVIQPVTLRIKKGMEGKYELVCGERRWLASKAVERVTMPAIVRELTDDEVLDLQFTENLQRQDVHPMDEAVTFRAMLDTSRYTVADIAAKVLKTEAFVVHRLSLNNLIASFQKDFWAGKFLIGHAVLFSRLTEIDQKECFKYYQGYDEYETIGEVRDHIDQAINRKLSSAPFKKDDAELVPKAGACTSCPKRSGCNNLLFDDYKDDDRCFDKTCFEKKLHAYLVNKVRTTLEEKPDILLVENGYYGNKVDPAIKKMASDMKVKILNASTSEVNSYKGGNYAVAVKCLMVSGDNAGQVKTMYLPGKPKSAVKGKDGADSPEDITQEITRIKDREKRSKELDIEKLHKLLVDQFKTTDGIKELNTPLSSLDKVAMLYLIVDSAGYSFQLRDQLKKVGIKLADGDKGWNELCSIPEGSIGYLVRNALLVKYGTNSVSYTAGRILHKYISLSFPDIFTALQADQQVAINKRQQRVDKRIADLQEKKKEATSKKKVAPDQKLVVTKKKAQKEKNLVDMSEEEIDAMDED